MIKLNSSKSLIGSIVLAGFIAGFGHLFYVGHDDLAQLVASCNEQSEKQLQQYQGKTCANDDLDCLWKKSYLVCQPEQLRDVSESDDTIQSQIKTKAQQVAGRSINVNMLTIVIALIGTFPAIWYFLLARLREISKAIRDK
jgi:hypothetical protein